MRVIWSCLLALLFVPGWTGEPRLDLLGPVAQITATRVALDPADPARRRIGALTFLGGVSLSSRDPAFGGFSAIHVAGGRITLLSDGGNIVSFALGKRGEPVAPHFANLPGGPGTGWTKMDRDSESMAFDPRGDTVLVAFENSNMIWRYSADFARALGASRPPAMKHWPGNEGAESMTIMPRGVIVIGEQDPWPGGTGRAAVWFTGDPIRARKAAFRFSYLPPAGYDPSDMTLLPDGRLIVLNRRLDWPFDFAVKLVILDPARIRPGAVVRGREIAALARPLIHDNFEGVAATREGDATMLWLVSDDNQTVLQRSLLLKFRLDDPPARRAR